MEAAARFSPFHPSALVNMKGKEGVSSASLFLKLITSNADGGGHFPTNDDGSNNAAARRTNDQCLPPKLPACLPAGVCVNVFLFVNRQRPANRCSKWCSSAADSVAIGVEFCSAFSLPFSFSLALCLVAN